MPSHSKARPFPNLQYLEIAYLFKVNPKVVREEWSDADVYEMLALHQSKDMAKADISKEHKIEMHNVITPTFCPVKKDGD